MDGLCRGVEFCLSSTIFGAVWRASIVEVNCIVVSYGSPEACVRATGYAEFNDCGIASYGYF